MKRTLELDPNDWNAHREYGWLLRRMGRYAESSIEMKRVQHLDPVSRFGNGNLVQSYLLTGDFDQAVEVQQKMVELYPERDSLHSRLAVAYAEKGLFDEALDELRRVTRPNRQTQDYLGVELPLRAWAAVPNKTLQQTRRGVETVQGHPQLHLCAPRS